MNVLGIFQSRKATMVLIAIVAITILVALGKVTSDQFMNFLMVTLPTWLAAQGFEDGMQKYNPVKPESNAAVVNTSINGVSQDQAAKVLQEATEQAIDRSRNP